MPVDPERLAGAFDAGLRRGFDRALDDHGVARGSPDWRRLRDLFEAQQKRTSTLWDDTSGDWPFTADDPFASLLLPRPSLYREALRARVRRATARQSSYVEGRRGEVTRLIDHEVSLALRTPGAGVSANPGKAPAGRRTVARPETRPGPASSEAPQPTAPGRDGRA
jgi:hypothetical protein